MPRDTSVRIFFFGDSICFGQGVSPHATWVVRIARALHERFGNDVDISVQNPSVNGNTTRMALERMPYDVQSHAPHILFVQFGMNDCNVWQTDGGHPRVSPAAFDANLSEIVARGRTFGAQEVILGTNHPTTRFDPMPNVGHSYDAANRAYNDLSRAVAQRLGTGLSDLEQACDAFVAAGKATYADLLLADQLHLSELGHDLYFAHRLPVIEDAVTRVLQTR